MRLGERLRRVPYYLDREARYAWMLAMPRSRVLRETLHVGLGVWNRVSERLENCLKSLRGQSLPEANIDVTIADLGSAPEVEAELRRLASAYRVRLVLLRVPDATWSRPYTQNAAVRCAAPRAKYLLTTDVDMIFQPRFCELLLRAHLAFPNAHVFGDWLNLPEGAVGPETDVVGDYERLRAKGTWVGLPGAGAFQSWPRAWFERVGGFDERMAGWGAEDDDLRARARRDGLRFVSLQRFATLCHQWHPTQSASAADPAARAEFERLKARNYEILHGDTSIVRNPGGWGELTPQAEVIEPVG